MSIFRDVLEQQVREANFAPSAGKYAGCIDMLEFGIKAILTFEAVKRLVKRAKRDYEAQTNFFMKPTWTITIDRSEIIREINRDPQRIMNGVDVVGSLDRVIIYGQPLWNVAAMTVGGFQLDSSIWINVSGPPIGVSVRLSRTVFVHEFAHLHQDKSDYDGSTLEKYYMSPHEQEAHTTHSYTRTYACVIKALRATTMGEFLVYKSAIIAVMLPTSKISSFFTATFGVSVSVVASFIGKVTKPFVRLSSTFIDYIHVGWAQLVRTHRLGNDIVDLLNQKEDSLLEGKPYGRLTETVYDFEEERAKRLKNDSVEVMRGLAHDAQRAFSLQSELEDETRAIVKSALAKLDPLFASPGLMRNKWRDDISWLEVFDLSMPAINTRAKSGDLPYHSWVDPSGFDGATVTALRMAASFGEEMAPVIRNTVADINSKIKALELKAPASQYLKRESGWNYQENRLIRCAEKIEAALKRPDLVEELIDLVTMDGEPGGAQASP